MLNKKKFTVNVVVIIAFFISGSFVMASDTKNDNTAKHEQSNNSELKIKETESETIPAKNITRHLSVNPDIAATKKDSPNSLSITGLKKGSTLVHIWDDDGRRTIRVVVEEKKKKK